MKTRTKTLMGLLVLALSSCTPGVKTVEGVIEDATMNNVTIITTKGDTVNFSTMDADKSMANGLLIGAPIFVTYTKDNVADTVKVDEKYCKLVGKWVEPINWGDVAIDENMPKFQGVELMVKGEAASVNMSSLQYKSWKLCKCGKLILSGESLGNGQTIPFTDTLNIDVLTADSLHLSNANTKVGYKRSVDL